MGDLESWGGHWMGPKVEPEARSCVNCVHYRRSIENGEYGSILSVSFECRRRPGVDALPSFPFRVTKCRTFERR